MSRDQKKIIFLFAIFALGLLAIWGRAFQLQVIDRQELMAYSEEQIFRSVTVYPHRGSIYDRNGSPLALNIETFSSFTIPQSLKDRKKTYRELRKILPEIDPKSLRAKIFDRNTYTWLFRKKELSKVQLDALKKVPGVYLESVPKRLYPNSELLAQTLGFVGIDNKGLAGIEYLFDDELRGRPKVLKYVKDAKGRALKFESQLPRLSLFSNLSKKNSSAANSKDVYLSIDKEVQAVAERVLKETVIEHHALGGGLGVLDAKSGELLAVANYPTYDANHLKSSEAKFQKLSFVSDPIEPGSTLKAFTVAAALEAGIVTPQTNYYCEKGQLRIGKHLVKDSEGHNPAKEWMSVSKILAESSNVGTTKIAFDIGHSKLRDFFLKLGFAKKTGIQIPGESRGIFNDEGEMSEIRLSNISFGQGISLTGIQLLAAYGAIANDGIYQRPSVLKKSEDEIKKDATRVMSKETANQIQQMLLLAVNHGTGDRAKIEHFQIAGKTSTAQRPDAYGGYTGHVPGFIGFPLGIDRPFVIYVYVDRPSGKKYYGNQVAAPAFQKIAHFILLKYKYFEQIKNQENALALEDLEEIPEVLDGKGENEKSLSLSLAAPLRIRNFDGKTVPNFLGLDKKTAHALAKIASLQVIDHGTGIVRSQSISPGVSLEGRPQIVLIYSPPVYD